MFSFRVGITVKSSIPLFPCSEVFLATLKFDQLTHFNLF